MDRSRLFVLIILVVLIIFLGVLVRQAAVILLAIPLLIYLSAGVLLAPQSLNLRAGRALTVRLANGLLQAFPPPGGQERVIPARSAVTVRVAVTNDGPGLSEVVIADRVWQHATSLATAASSEWEYTFSPSRGRTVFPDLKALVGDPFGLFTRQVSVKALTDGEPEGSLLTLPEVIALKRITLRPPQLSGYAGPVAARLPGSGTDFFGVREYQPGDSPRHLNWRISSRRERELFTNQFEGERFADIGLILDARHSRNLVVVTGETPVKETSELFEYAVIGAASLGRAFLRDGHRLSLLVYGFSIDRLPPGTGRVQSERLARALANARTLHNYALDNLDYLPTRMFPPRSQIVFVSPLGEEDFEPLVRYRALGYDVLVLSPNPVSFEARQILKLAPKRALKRESTAAGEALLATELTKPAPAGDLQMALRLATIERELLIRRLARFGVWVVDWPVDRPLAEALRKGLAPLRRGQRMLKI